MSVISLIDELGNVQRETADSHKVLEREACEGSRCNYFKHQARELSKLILQNTSLKEQSDMPPTHAKHSAINVGVNEIDQYYIQLS